MGKKHTTIAIKKGPGEKEKKLVEEMTLFDNELMHYVFQGDTECTQLLLRILLENKDLEVVAPAKVEDYHANRHGREIRLDVTCKDRNGNFYVIEIQNDVDETELAHRSDYYSSHMERSRTYDQEKLSQGSAKKSSGGSEKIEFMERTREELAEIARKYSDVTLYTVDPENENVMIFKELRDAYENGELNDNQIEVYEKELSAARLFGRNGIKVLVLPEKIIGIDGEEINGTFPDAISNGRFLEFKKMKTDNYKQFQRELIFGLRKSEVVYMEALSGSLSRKGMARDFANAINGVVKGKDKYDGRVVVVSVNGENPIAYTIKTGTPVEGVPLARLRLEPPTYLNDNSNVTNVNSYQDAGNITSDNFKSWFGDWENDPEHASKVVDEDGRPLVVYHGPGNYGFTVFNTHLANTNLGSHFGDLDAAEHFVDSGDEIYYVYLNIRNPLYTEDIYAQDTNFEQVHLAARLAHEIGTPEAMAIYEKVKDHYPWIDEYKDLDDSDFYRKVISDEDGPRKEDELYNWEYVHNPVYNYGSFAEFVKNATEEEKFIWNNGDFEFYGWLKDLIRMAGYAGIKYENAGEGGISWIVFEPEQIKSATDNNGEYDTANPDIRFQEYNAPGSDSFRVITISMLPKGKAYSYRDIQDRTLLFILRKDIYSLGLPRYHVERVVRELENNPFDEGLKIIFINGEYRGDDALGHLMKDFSCVNPEEMYYEVLRARVAYVKSSEEYIMNISAAAQRIYDNGKREWDKEREELNRQMAQKDYQMAQKDRQMAQKDYQMAQKDRQMAQKDKEIEELKRYILENGLSPAKS